MGTHLCCLNALSLFETVLDCFLNHLLPLFLALLSRLGFFLMLAFQFGTSHTALIPRQGFDELLFLFRTLFCLGFQFSLRFQFIGFLNEILIVIIVDLQVLVRDIGADRLIAAAHDLALDVFQCPFQFFFREHRIVMEQVIRFKFRLDTGIVLGDSAILPELDYAGNELKQAVSAHAMYDTDENRRTQDKAVSNGTFKVQSEFCPSIQEDSKKR